MPNLFSFHGRRSRATFWTVKLRRWHDLDRSGWWMAFLLVPLVGAVWYLVECGFRPGTAGPNRYGPDPLAGQRDAWKRA